MIYKVTNVMTFSVVSQSLSFTEESVVITEVSEKVVETQIKEDVEYTVKIVVLNSNFQFKRLLFQQHKFNMTSNASNTNKKITVNLICRRKLQY